MKHKFLWRAMAFLIALSLFSLPTLALTPAYTVSGAYKGSTYHNNLLTLPLTGDKAFDVVAIALSQLDYREGNSTADFDGEREGGSKNFTEFNRFLGKISGSYSYAWCAAFASWCLRQAEAGDSAGGSFASCTLWVERLRELGQYATRSSGYTPKRGDLIFFRSAGVSRASDHVGIVRYVKNGRVYTIEGNASNRVSARDYALTDTYIVGYGKPSYNSGYTRLGSNCRGQGGRLLCCQQLLCQHSCRGIGKRHEAGYAAKGRAGAYRFGKGRLGSFLLPRKDGLHLTGLRRLRQPRPLYRNL